MSKEKCNENEKPLCLDEGRATILYAAVQNAYQFAPMISDHEDPDEAEGLQKTAQELEKIGYDLEELLDDFGVNYEDIEPTTEQVPEFAQKALQALGLGGN